MSQPPYPNGMPAGARINYSAGSAHNGAAIASVVFGLLWLFGLAVPFVINATTSRVVEPAQVLETCAGFVLWVGGPLAIVFGHVGLYRAVRHRELRGSLGWAIAGVLLGYLWLAALLFLTEAGIGLLYWVTHLF